MRKVFSIALTIVLMATFSFNTMAFNIPSSETAREHSQAPDHSPVITEDWDLIRVDFPHPAKNSNAVKTKTDPGYKLLGVKWKQFPVDYIINPSNSGLSEAFITETISAAAEEWDNNTDTTDLFSSGVINYTAKYGVQNFKNEISFGSYADNSTIAVTSIWYSRATKEIVEFDILFNTYYTWGDGENDPALMDLLNIATHELGHGVGMGDVYNTAYDYVTMYGYSSNGDIIKRDLAPPDIIGLEKMYGQ